MKAHFDPVRQGHFGTHWHSGNDVISWGKTFASNGVQRMVTTKQFDLLNRLTNSSSSVSFVYAYNSANQRTRTTLADGSYWVYIYDSLGQVISGRKY